MSRWVGLLTVLFILACGGLEPTVSSPPTAATEAAEVPSAEPKRDEDHFPHPPKSDLPVITRAGGVGDSAASFHARYRPATGSNRMVPRYTADGWMLAGMYEDNYYTMNAAEGVMTGMTIQLEARENLPRGRAWELAMQHAPRDGKKVRSFTDTLGSDVTVFHSELLAKNLPESRKMAECYPLGTYQVALQRIENDPTYFGIVIGIGVAYDDNDPEGNIDC